ncbi:hypothetical protein J3459_017698 [Metarhizium acridum]|nr:hypothetical protein J3459_018484 [Metarhizium acridum]KAG8409161.1 hypothetical protein J3459_017698 [Metarhizium acridum]
MLLQLRSPLPREARNDSSWEDLKRKWAPPNVESSQYFMSEDGLTAFGRTLVSGRNTKGYRFVSGAHTDVTMSLLTGLVADEVAAGFKDWYYGRIPQWSELDVLLGQESRAGIKQCIKQRCFVRKF